MPESITPQENPGDKAKNEISEENLLFTIWFKPKSTLEYILKFCPDKFVIPLLILGGISRAFDQASNKNYGDSQSLFSVIFLAIIGGGLFGWISYYLYIWLLDVSGKWLQGKGSFSELKTITAWSLVPSIFSLVFLIPEIILFGIDLFRSEMSGANGIKESILYILGLLEFTCGIWTLVIFIKGVSIVQDFSTSKSILNAILPLFMLLILILSFVFIIKTYF